MSVNNNSNSTKNKGSQNTIYGKNKNSFNNVDNSINNSNINITNMFQKSNDKEVEDIFERPLLALIYNEKKNKQGPERLIRCIGCLTPHCINVKGRRLNKVLNILTNNSVFVDDHVWIDIKPDKYNYENEYKSRFIEFIGSVESYDRKDGSTGYAIDIVKQVICLPDTYINKNIKSFDHVSYDENKITKFREIYTSDKYYDIIDKLQLRLNNLTDYFGNNYLFDYIINTITMGSAKKQLYQNKIERVPFSDNMLMKIINVLAHIIYVLEGTTLSFNILELLAIITNACNIVQNITNYKSQSDEFNNFCEIELHINKDSRQAERLWNNVNHRRRNFGVDPNPYNLSIEEINLNAYMVLYDYIE